MALKKHIAKYGIAVLTVALVLSLGVAAGTAFAYYTDTQQAKGMIPFSYIPENPDNPDNPKDPEDPKDPDTPTTDVDESPDDKGQKTVAVRNTGTVPAMVRVKLFYPDFPEGSGVSITTEFKGAASEWTQNVVGRDVNGDSLPNDEGWFYWPHPLAPGESTPSFKVKVTLEEETFNQAFDIVVVQQCTSSAGFIEGEPYLGAFAEGEKYLAIEQEDSSEDGE